MTSYFPDVNLWIALSDPSHPHSQDAWNWLHALDEGGSLLFSRLTQLGFLRLLTTQAVMGPGTLTLGEAWRTYDRWLTDPRVVYHPEPPGLDQSFREVTAPLAKLPAPKSVGDAFLLAFARQSGATLVTFDRALHAQARKSACASILPR